MPEVVYDCRSGFDSRVVWALRMVGVNLKEHVWSSGKLKGHCIRFTYICDSEFAKGIISDFIADEYEGSNCKFFASRDDKRSAYVIYDEGRVHIHVED